MHLGEDKAVRELTTSLAETRDDEDSSEDRTLNLLKESDLPPSEFEKLALAPRVMRSRKLKFAIVTHARAPRHVALPLIRHLFPFDLMRVGLSVTAPGDIKKVADDILIGKLGSIAAGERLALAKRASGKVACALLLDQDCMVISAALNNPRVTETLVIRALRSAGEGSLLVPEVSKHPKWSLRPDVRLALLCCAVTALDYALIFAKSLPSSAVAEALGVSKLPSSTKRCICSELNIPQSD